MWTSGRSMNSCRRRRRRTSEAHALRLGDARVLEARQGFSVVGGSARWLVCVMQKLVSLMALGWAWGPLSAWSQHDVQRDAVRLVALGDYEAAAKKLTSKKKPNAGLLGACRS